jgi:hypothetical protein
LAAFFLILNSEVSGCRHFLDRRGPTPDIVDPKLLGAVIVGLKSLSEGPQVDVKDGAIGIGLMLFYDNGLFGGVHAAN